jgi:hypothetical protein
MSVQREPDRDGDDGFLPVDAERRRAHREGVIAIGRLCAPGSRSRGIKVLVCDLSLRGVRFRTSATLAAGRVYDFQLVLGPLKVRSRLRIVRTTRAGGHLHHVGAEFI